MSLGELSSMISYSLKTIILKTYSPLLFMNNSHFNLILLLQDPSDKVVIAIIPIYRSVSKFEAKLSGELRLQYGFCNPKVSSLGGLLGDFITVAIFLRRRHIRT